MNWWGESVAHNALLTQFDLLHIGLGQRLKDGQLVVCKRIEQFGRDVGEGPSVHGRHCIGPRAGRLDVAGNIRRNPCPPGPKFEVATPRKAA